MNLEQFTEKIAVDLQTTLPHKYAHVEVRSRNVERIGGSYLGIELKPEGNLGPLLKARKYYEEYMHGTTYFHSSRTNRIKQKVSGENSTFRN